VERFLATRGESRLVQLRTQRDEASASLAFESAAAIHTQVQRAEAVRALAPELVRPLSQLRAVILHTAAGTDHVAVFLFEQGRLRGPAAFSTLGMRIQNEQSGSSSLYAQPLALEPVPEEQGSGTRDQGPGSDEGPRDEGRESAKAAKAARGMLEGRLEATLAELMSPIESPNAVVRQGHLALLKRWYYRPEVKRPGEVFFPDDEGTWPVKAILRGIGRIAAKSLTAANMR
jgi:hypothetical protein